jgi:DNA-binding transcriptional LysR family regulator
LDAALALLPTGRIVPAPLTSTIVDTDEMMLVAAPGLVSRKDASSVLSLGRHPLVLNPPGCLLRASLIEELQAAGVPINIVAEVHNPHVQLALVLSGIGVGLLPSRFVRRHARAREIAMLRPKRFRLGMDILLVRGGALGSLELVAADLRESLTAR